MIKNGNNIRFGNKIFIVESHTDNEYLLKDKESNLLHWITKKDLIENLEKINFSYNILNESKSSKLSYKNEYLTIVIEEHDIGSEINILTESEIYSKIYPYSKKRAIYEFEKYFKYTNELTPYKLCNTGFKKHRLN